MGYIQNKSKIRESKLILRHEHVSRMSWVVRQRLHRSTEIRLVCQLVLGSNKIAAARRICSRRRRQRRKMKPRFEQFPHFGLADKDDKDEGASQDVEDVRENPIFEIAFNPKGNDFRQPGHAH